MIQRRQAPISSAALNEVVSPVERQSQRPPGRPGPGNGRAAQAQRVCRRMRDLGHVSATLRKGSTSYYIVEQEQAKPTVSRTKKCTVRG